MKRFDQFPLNHVLESFWILKPVELRSFLDSKSVKWKLRKFNKKIKLHDLV